METAEKTLNTVLRETSIAGEKKIKGAAKTREEIFTELSSLEETESVKAN